jgi:hypothetical protein
MELNEASSCTSHLGRGANAIVGGGRHPLLVSSFSGQAEPAVTPLVQASCEHRRDVTIRGAWCKKKCLSIHPTNAHSRAHNFEKEFYFSAEERIKF